MVGRVKILATAVVGVAGVEMLFGSVFTAATFNHLLAAADFYTRLAIVRGFEMVYRVYTLPL